MELVASVESAAPEGLAESAVPVAWVELVVWAELANPAESVALAGLAESVDRVESAVPDVQGRGNFPLVEAAGSIIPRTVAERRMRIARLRTGSVVLRGATRFRIGRGRRDSRLASRAEIWVAHAAVVQALEIAAAGLAAVAVWAVARESAGPAQEVEATASETAAFLPAAAAEARSVADRPASADRAPGQAARVALRALAVAVAAAAAVVGVVVVEGAGNCASRVIGAV